MNSISLPDSNKLPEIASPIQIEPCQVNSQSSQIDYGLEEEVEGNRYFWSLFPLHSQASIKKERNN